MGHTIWFPSASEIDVVEEAGGNSPTMSSLLLLWNMLGTSAQGMPHEELLATLVALLAVVTVVVDVLGDCVGFESTCMFCVVVIFE
jgi:hypothetical protein